MNLFIFTARIITVPRLYRHNKKPIAQMWLCLANTKKKSPWYNICANARGKLAHQIFQIHRKGDFVIIKGSITIKSKKISSSGQSFKVKKNIKIQIQKIYTCK